MNFMSYALYFLLFPLCIVCLYTQDMPTQDNSQPKRSSYESLTERRGTFLLRQQEKEKNSKAAQDKVQKDQNETKSYRALLDDLTSQTPAPPALSNVPTDEEIGPVINFNNVNITEILKYISRLTGKNFLYDPNELQFNITMISETPTTLQDLMAMTIQSLQIHGYLVTEQENGYVIHANPAIKGIAKLQPENNSISGPQITTQIFNLQNTPADKCAAIIKAMSSDNAIVATVSDSKIVMSDISENILKIHELITKLDLETPSLEIGQYVVVNTSPYALASLVQRMVLPMAASKVFVLIPHSGSNSIYIVSTPYLVEKALGLLQMVDLSRQKSGLLSDENTKFNPDLQSEALRKANDDTLGGLSGLDNFTRQDIENMPLEQVQDELMKRGYTLEEVLALPAEIARSILWQLLTAEREAKNRAINQRLELGEDNIPLGQTESTHFYIHKMQYRKASEVANALKAIALSMMGGNQATSSAPSATPGAPSATGPNSEIMQSDLLMTLTSLQPVDDNNIIVFTGTKASIEKVKELIAQIDLPVRQVFIEALVLDTTLSDSLNFGVEWGAKIIGRSFGAQVGFVNPNASPFSTPFNAMTINDANVLAPVHITPPATSGFSAGSIGRKIMFHGRGFRSTGALVNALKSDDEVHIILNPKIVTEHNIPAEIFVGQQIPIKGQSLLNATSGTTSSVVTSNYDTKNVGISLKVTPLISSRETVTLIVDQKISTASATQVSGQGSSTAPPATINETRATTRVHLPSDHFLVLSGLMQESLEVKKDMLPCLGGLPLVGSLFGNKLDSTSNRNVMIFIRPIIIDTEADVDEITKHQEQIFKEKSKVQQGWNKQLDTGKMLLNLEPQ